MQILLPVSILIFFGIGGWATAYVGRSRHLTISQHVAQSKVTRTWFAIVASIATVLISVSLFFWLLPHHQATALSYVIFGFIMAGFLLSALISRIEGSRARFHDVAAWGMCYIIPIAMLDSLTWPLPLSVRIISAILFAVVIVLLILLFTVPRLRKDFLLFQSFYLAIFFLFLMLLNYT